ncbi:MAG: hypothetical protein ACRBDI_08800 [Alphaproteobacteria bacterium]
MRDKLVLSMLVMFALGACLSLFFGSSAVIEKDQFTLVFTAGSLRILSVMGLCLFVIFFIRRSFDGKDIEFLLSRPVGRIHLILSYFVAFSILCFIMSFAVGLCLYAVSPHLFSQAHLIWLLSILVENIIMVSAALFFSMYISSAASAAMVTFGFYALARMMGQLIGIIDSSLIDSGGGLSMALQLVSVVTPRLDLLGQSSWLLYGVPYDGFGMMQIIGQGVVFCSLVLCAACYDFSRRAF